MHLYKGADKICIFLNKEGIFKGGNKESIFRKILLSNPINPSHLNHLEKLLTGAN